MHVYLSSLGAIRICTKLVPTSENREVINAIHNDKTSEQDFIILARVDRKIDSGADPRPTSAPVPKADEEFPPMGYNKECSQRGWS